MKNKETTNTSSNSSSSRISREQMIAKVIGGRYSIDDQIAIIRQKDTKPEEWEAFNAFAEEVKKKVTEEYAGYEAAGDQAQDGEPGE